MSDTKVVRVMCKHREFVTHFAPEFCQPEEIVLHPADPYPTQPGRTRYWREEVGERYEIVFDADGKTLAEVEDLFFNLGKADAE